MKRTRMASYGLCLTLALAGCSGAANNGAGDGAPVVDGGTFTLGLSSDPGALDPQMGAGTSLFTVTQFAYDPLVSVDGESGEIRSALATSWKAEGTTVELTLNEGITCDDGSALTATAVADNLNFVADPKNSSPFLGVFLPAGVKAAGDDASRVVTLTLAQPAPFVLNGLASLPIVCPSGLKNRAALTKTTSGTGPYKLVEAAPGDHYTYQVRDGYTWGPDGATTATKGMPKTVVVKIVENESTAANLLVSGGLSAAQVAGPDSARLEKAGLFTAETPALSGEQWYNHAKGRVTDDPQVRLALTRALDLAQLQKVLTSGKGSAATVLATNAPAACPGDSVSKSLPSHDPAAAGALLDQAGWTKGADGTRAKAGKPLKLTFLYQNTSGSGGNAAAELAVKQWKAVGVDATAKSQNETTLTGTIFGAGDWDVAWVSLNVNSPDQLVPFLSGPAAPKGTNFAAIADADYTEAVTAAAALPGAEGCDKWLAAESDLIKKASIVPFANTTVRTFGKASKFETPGQLVPTSIRMLAK
ncbi:ABC transporter substrate-binding protein [Cryptosporangium arvum]|uniref:ABC-type dipeptide transport system, periplasmic component n=1 Tax=Cryptosporangium arvum DSM 44712 TaxID=927661 RepID=A0A010ZVY9_9ACTN|nr:ABC transporter substrate-binding protein [Cryptosporangium arvum]EXG82834.1 ABC-type dipeptide transport system, periplasmic component [Cryptosporangium arvum DSM 44712]